MVTFAPINAFLFGARATTAQLYPGWDTFEFDQGHVTKNQLIEVLLSENVKVYSNGSYIMLAVENSWIALSNDLIFKTYIEINKVNEDLTRVCFANNSHVENPCVDHLSLTVCNTRGCHTRSARGTRITRQLSLRKASSCSEHKFILRVSRVRKN